MPKLKNEFIEENEKKRRKVITLEMKLAIIKRFESGVKKANIGREFGLSESTIRCVLKKTDQYRDLGKSLSTSSTVFCIRNRSPLMIEMEDHLITWLEDCNQKKIPVSTNNVRDKALSLFMHLKETKFQDETVNFTASKGWFEKFKCRAGLKNVRITGEEGSDQKDSSKFGDELQNYLLLKSIEENGNDYHQIVDETDLDSKKLPSRTYLTSQSDYKEAKNRIKYLLERNTDENIKLEPPVDDKTDNPKTNVKELNFEFVNTKEDPMLLDSHSKVLVEEKHEDDLIECVQSRDEEKKVSLVKFEELFHDLESIKRRIMEMDPDSNRSKQVCLGLESQIECYRKMYIEKTKEKC